MMNKKFIKQIFVYVRCQDISKYKEKIAEKISEMESVETKQGKIIKSSIVFIYPTPKVVYYYFETKLKFTVKICYIMKMYPSVGDIIEQIKIINNGDIIKANILDKKYKGLNIFLNAIPKKDSKIEIVSKKIDNGKLIINGVVR